MKSENPLNVTNQSASNLQVIAIIGIRSQSKGVPDKNIRNMCGHPLVAWIIKEALNSKLVGKVVVSTDSQRYADIAKEYGADVPFLRPCQLATDTSMEIEYVRHAVQWYIEHSTFKPGIAVRLQATSPLQTSEDIDGVLELLMANPDADSAMVVAESNYTLQRAIRIEKDDLRGRRIALPYFSDNPRELTPINRQSKAPAYFRANVIATRVSCLIDKQSQSGDVVLPYVIPQERAVDIDSEADFRLAEFLLPFYKSQY